MEKGDYTISDVYQGGFSAMTPPSDSNYSAAGDFGITTDFRNANILQEVSTKLSSGIQNVEITAIQPDIFDSMPKQQLREVNRLAKLTGIDVTLHGPLIEASGIGQQGFSESEREAAERKITNALIRSHDLNPDGNIKVTFHSSSGIPGSQFLAPKDRTEKTQYRKLIAVNKDSGRAIPLEGETKFYPGIMEKPEFESPEHRLAVVNGSEWSNQMDQVFFNQERAQEILGRNQAQIHHLLSDPDVPKKENGELDLDLLNSKQKNAYMNMGTAYEYIQDVHKQVSNFFSKAHEFGTAEQKAALEKLNVDYSKIKSQVEKGGFNPFGQAEATRFLINELKKPLYAPEMYVPIEDFAVQKSSETFGAAALAAYKQFKDTAPVIVIENPPAGSGLSTGEDIKNLVEASRTQFIKKAIAPEAQGGLGISESQAKKQAEKLIGATWDVGHINMLRGQGYSEADVIKETEIVAPYVKHIHLSDNFGLEHTELPMGMGNVPLKQMMEKLGENGYDAKKIIEAGNWWQHFKSQPFQETLEAVNSPIYGMKMGPGWGQANNLYEGYNIGLEGQYLPQGNYETFGTSFARLPAELGGTRASGSGGRMSGRPME